MTIRSFVRVFSIVGIIFIAMFTAGIIALQQSAKNTRQAKEKQLVSLALSRETSDNSFGLTADVRSYVASGNPLFKDNYFRILDVRSGKIPRPDNASIAPGRRVKLDDLYDEVGFTVEEKERLSEANRLSGILAELETKAMADFEAAPPEQRDRASLEASLLLHSNDYLDAAKKYRILSPSLSTCCKKG